MNKTIVAISLLSTLAAHAQVSPLENHQSTILTHIEAKKVWGDMRTDFESGSECFNRAMSWTYDIHKKYGYEAKKILIHYSYKYNQELSAKWGFHIAPMYNVEGSDIVLDKGFEPWLHAPVTPKMWQEKFLIAGTEKLVEKRIKIKNKIQKVEEQIRDLDKSSEFYYDGLRTRQERLRELNAKLKEFGVTDADLRIQQPKKLAQVQKWIEYLSKEIKKVRKRTRTYDSLKFQLDYQKELLKKVRSDLNYAAHIECKKIDSIEELDYNQNEAWCYIQEVSQYYWGVPQLRLLNYGPGHGMNSLPLKSELPSARREGSKYAHHNDFDMGEVWFARRQAFGAAHKEIWKKEYELREEAKDAVKNIYKLTKKLDKTLDDAIDLVNEIDSASKKKQEVKSYVTNANTIYISIINNKADGDHLREKIYAIKNSVQVSDTKTKVNNYNQVEKMLSESERNIERLENILDNVKDKVKAIEKKERDAKKEEDRRRRRRERENRRRN